MNVEAVRKRLIAELDRLEVGSRDLLMQALSLAEQAHSGQFRKVHRDGAGERDPYIIHPMRVALLLLEDARLRETSAIAAAILHDVIEDTDGRITREHLEDQFGAEIASMVSLLSKPVGKGKDLSEDLLEQYHQQVTNAPPVVRLVKCADRLDNMRDILLFDKPDFQRRYLRETREAYLPLAKETSQLFYTAMSEICDQLDSFLGPEP